MKRIHIYLSIITSAFLIGCSTINIKPYYIPIDPYPVKLNYLTAEKTTKSDINNRIISSLKNSYFSEFHQGTELKITKNISDKTNLFFDNQYKCFIRDNVLCTSKIFTLPEKYKEIVKKYAVSKNPKALLQDSLLKQKEIALSEIKLLNLRKKLLDGDDVIDSLKEIMKTERVAKNKTKNLYSLLDALNKVIKNLFNKNNINKDTLLYRRRIDSLKNISTNDNMYHLRNKELQTNISTMKQAIYDTQTKIDSLIKEKVLLNSFIANSNKSLILSQTGSDIGGGKSSAITQIKKSQYDLIAKKNNIDNNIDILNNYHKKFSDSMSVMKIDLIQNDSILNKSNLIKNEISKMELIKAVIKQQDMSHLSKLINSMIQNIILSIPDTNKINSVISNANTLISKMKIDNDALRKEIDEHQLYMKNLKNNFAVVYMVIGIGVRTVIKASDFFSNLFAHDIIDPSVAKSSNYAVANHVVMGIQSKKANQMVFDFDKSQSAFLYSFAEFEQIVYDTASVITPSLIGLYSPTMDMEELMNIKNDLLQDIYLKEIVFDIP